MNVKIATSCLTATLALVAHAAQAQGSAEPSSNWQPTARYELVHRSSTGVKAYVDRESISRSGGIVTYWSYYHDQENSENPVILAISLQEMNCQTHQFRWLESSYVIRDGQKAFYQDPPDNEWHYVIPVTDGEAELRFVCRLD